ncbi:probable aminotransferase ACS12 isoform X2 [Malus sylvestris]|uniref:probable aminotransferase ACS12 isoform X2 n=1 Tax=Malus sylvestris TaxID=3752 RepID=UPI0021AD00A6|nr:probable aminotransferase ACS12 isoform X2 [Malus sylvestris]
MGPVRMSSRASWVAKPNDSPYYIGLDRASEDPYYRVDNPDGVIQLGLSENRLCLDLIEKWVSENLMESMVGTDGGDLSISGIAAYQPFDGMTKLKVKRKGLNICLGREFRVGLRRQTQPEKERRRRQLFSAPKFE